MTSRFKISQTDNIIFKRTHTILLLSVMYIDLRYTDDIILIAGNFVEMKEQLEQLRDIGISYDLGINNIKTKLMVIEEI